MFECKPRTLLIQYINIHGCLKRICANCSSDLRRHGKIRHTSLAKSTGGAFLCRWSGCVAKNKIHYKSTLSESTYHLILSCQMECKTRSQSEKQWKLTEHTFKTMVCEMIWWGLQSPSGEANVLIQDLTTYERALWALSHLNAGQTVSHFGGQRCVK